MSTTGARHILAKVTPLARDIAEEIATDHSALPIALLSEKGGTGAFQDPTKATAALDTIAPEQFTHNLNSFVAQLRRRAPGQKIGVVGFCFGGGLVWQLLDRYLK